MVRTDATRRGLLAGYSTIPNHAVRTGPERAGAHTGRTVRIRAGLSVAAIGLSGGDKMEAALARILARVERPGTLRVGFLESSKYPDGTSVAMVAAGNEFGAPGARIPPRPFFRPMIEAKSPRWGAALGAALKATDMNGTTALGMLGELIKGQLQASIKAVHSPELSPVTLMARQIAGNQKPTFLQYIEAVRRVKAGETASLSATGSKPLVHTGYMVDEGVGYEVKS